MRILLAPDKFKGCLSAPAVCDAMAGGILRADPAIAIDACPMADGGEGTVAALVEANGGKLVTRTATGPLPEMRVEAAFGLLDGGKTAVIEMAAASGLALLRPDELDPMATTTFGTGELIRYAVEMGCRRIIVGIGGSATTDGGLGAVQACAGIFGTPILLADGETLHDTEPLCGRDIAKVMLVKHARGGNAHGVELVVASDVTAPLYGPCGAAHLFGPQKGATPQMVKELDAALKELARRTGHEQTALRPGAGAAGGLGFGLMAYLGAKLEPGFELVARQTRLGERVSSADLCLTGEGRLDASSTTGKTAMGVARICRAAGVPCIAIVGSIDPSLAGRWPSELDAAFSICSGPMSLGDACSRATELIAWQAASAFQLFAAAKKGREE